MTNHNEKWWDRYLLMETVIELSLTCYSYSRGFYGSMFLQIAITLVSLLPGISTF